MNQIGQNYNQIPIDNNDPNYNSGHNNMLNSVLMGSTNSNTKLQVDNQRKGLLNAENIDPQL